MGCCVFVCVSARCSNGYEGFHSETELPIMLTEELVASIHHAGGSVIGAGRGGFDIPKTLRFLLDNGVNQVYVIGGDGTMRAANMLAQAVAAEVCSMSRRCCL